MTGQPSGLKGKLYSKLGETAVVVIVAGIAHKDTGRFVSPVVVLLADSLPGRSCLLTTDHKSPPNRGVATTD